VLLDNVIEHVNNIDAVIAEAFRILKPGGYLYLLAPNYAAFRKEAHYGLPWLPYLPRAIARPYIRFFRGNTAFFNHLNYTTSWGIWRKIKRHPVHLLWPTLVKLDHPEQCRNAIKRKMLSWAKTMKLTPVIKTLEAARLRNPCIRRIEFLAQKQSTP
jgi:SAM-dependent methyltransferase